MVAEIMQRIERMMHFWREHLGNKPVSAIIFTHSHIDHFGGVLGVLASGLVQAENIRIIAPEASWRRPPARISSPARR